MFNETILKANLRTNEKGIHQTDRNNLRLSLLNELSNFLLNEKVELKVSKEGIAISTFNEEIGEVNFVIDIKMKDFSFNFDEFDTLARAKL